ncbi:MAG: helix-turn-helix domain-containing protein [Ktedonobacteraceae bacterium]
MNIEDYRIKLGWSQAELARRANIDINTLKRAINGERVFKHTVGAIATALSRGLGQDINYHDLDDVNVKD